ncbi:MAG: UDP-glucose dehydrogenase family protein [Acidimicrobiia bacterium]
MQIAVIGTGYVGLVTGAGFAHFGHAVTCVDSDAAKIAALNRGEIPIYEPGLEELVDRNVADGRLTFTTDLAAAVPVAEAVFVAVGTPAKPGGEADLSQVIDAVGAIAEAADDYIVVATKSTVPVGTARSLQQLVEEARPDAEIDMASTPEFLRQGSAVRYFLEPDRVVIGVETAQAQAVLAEIYRPLVESVRSVLFTDFETAELIKYTANAYLATKLAFMNEIADVSERVGADAGDVARGIGLDRRIGEQFLAVGPGFGGSCLPKDSSALAHTARALGVPTRIIEAAVEANTLRMRAMADKVISACGGSVTGKTVAVLGLTFKANTDDLRKSPGLDIVSRLTDAGAKIRAFDPQGMARASAVQPQADYCGDAYEAIDGADVAVIATEWQDFRNLDLDRVRTLLARPLIVDLRNLFDPKQMARAGLEYHSVGRPPARPDEPLTD